MASGKASPRQKMINMMYLVLTALLALNVSAEILLSFQTIADSLNSSQAKLGKKNDDLGSNIKSSVDEEIKKGNNKNESLKGEVDELIGETNKVIQYLDNHIEELKKPEIAGVDETTGRLGKTDETEANYRYWMKQNGQDTDNDGRGAGQAKELRDRLRKYIDWANNHHAKLLDEKVPQKYYSEICIDPKNDPTIPAESEIKNKSWEYYTFHGSPAIANVAIIQKLKNDVRVIEAELLEIAKSKLKDVVFKIDSLIAIDAPVSQVVAAGLPFESKIYVTASSTQMIPKFSGAGVSTDKGGKSGKIKLIADGRVIPQGKNEGKQSYSASILVPTANGGEKRLSVKGTFTVRKPEIVITSAAVQILYAACGNDLNVDVPALGDAYNPKITAEGGQVSQSKEKKTLVRVVPSEKTKKLTLIVNTLTNGQDFRIGTVAYNVIPPPKPNIQMKVGTTIVGADAKIGMKSTVTVQVVPEPNFGKALPADARYQIGKTELLVKTGLGAPRPVKTVGPSGVAAVPTLDINLATALTDPRPGTVVYFKIDKVDRINFLKQNVEEPFTERELYLVGELK